MVLRDSQSSESTESVLGFAHQTHCPGLLGPVFWGRPIFHRQHPLTGVTLTLPVRPQRDGHQNWTGDSQPRTSSRKQEHRSAVRWAYVSAGDWRGGVSAQPSHRSQPGTVSQSVHIDLTFHSSQTHRPDVPPPSSRSQPNPVPTAQLTTHILAQSTRS